MKRILLFGILLGLVSCDREKEGSGPGTQEPVVVVIENGDHEDPGARQKAIDDAVEKALAKRDQERKVELKQVAEAVLVEDTIEIPKAVRVAEPIAREDRPREAKQAGAVNEAPMKEEDIPEARPVAEPTDREDGPREAKQAGAVNEAPMKEEDIPEARPVGPEDTTREDAPQVTKKGPVKVEEIPEAKSIGPQRPAEVVRPPEPNSSSPLFGKEEVTGGSERDGPGEGQKMAHESEESGVGGEADRVQPKPIVPSLNVERPKLDFEDTTYFHSFKDGEEPAKGDDVLVGPWTDMTGPWGSLKDALKGVFPAANFEAGKPLEAAVLRRLGKKDLKAAALLGWYVEARSQKVRARSVYALPEAVEKEAVAGGAAATSGNPSPYQGLPSPGGGVAVVPGGGIQPAPRPVHPPSTGGGAPAVVTQPRCPALDDSDRSAVSRARPVSKADKNTLVFSLKGCHRFKRTGALVLDKPVNTEKEAVNRASGNAGAKAAMLAEEVGFTILSSKLVDKKVIGIAGGGKPGIKYATPPKRGYDADVVCEFQIRLTGKGSVAVGTDGAGSGGAGSGGGSNAGNSGGGTTGGGTGSGKPDENGAIERPALAITWTSQSGKTWYAHGPVQKLIVGEKTEAEALAMVARVGRKYQGKTVTSSFVKHVTIAKLGKTVKLYRLNYTVKDSNKSPTWDRDLRYIYPELKGF